MCLSNLKIGLISPHAIDMYTLLRQVICIYNTGNNKTITINIYRRVGNYSTPANKKKF